MQRLLPLLFILASMAAVAQRPAWTPVPSNAGIIQNQGSQRSSFPTEYRLFELDLAPLREAMMGIAGPDRTATKAVITLPDASGKPENFEITEASNFHPDLQAPGHPGLFRPKPYQPRLHTEDQLIPFWCTDYGIPERR